MLEKFIRKEAGKQKPTRMPSTVITKIKKSSTALQTRTSISSPTALKNAAKMPITQSAANEIRPVFVIIFSKFLKLMIAKI